MRRLFLLLVPAALALRAPAPRVARVAPVAAGLATAETPTRVVMKFGGASLRDAARIEEVGALVAATVDAGVLPTVVVSALGKTTNAIEAASRVALDEGRVRVDDVRSHHLETMDALGLAPRCGTEVRALLRDLEALLDGVSMVRELTERTRDLLASFGERMSARVLAAHLAERHGLEARAYDAWDLGLRTRGRFGDAQVDDACYPALAANLDAAVGANGAVPVVTGYVGHDAHGRVATLGRGGSDLTATVLGACAPGSYDEVQVWKDVDGMMTADPRAVASAAPVPFVTYEEASELAYFGASVLHPISMLPALRANVPVRVKNAYNKDHPGTLIADASTIAAAREAAGVPRPAVTALTSKRDVTLVDVSSTRMLGQPGFLARIFAVLEADDVSVDVVATSEVSVSLTLDKKYDGDNAISARALAELEKIAAVTVKRRRAIVAFIADVARSTDLIARVFAVLAADGVAVEMLSQGASKVNISLVVEDADAARALALLHAAFFEPADAPTAAAAPLSEAR